MLTATINIIVDYGSVIPALLGYLKTHMLPLVCMEILSLHCDKTSTTSNTVTSKGALQRNLSCKMVCNRQDQTISTS